ncbi:MAG: ATP-binding protein [Balneolaceae bacterium]
MAFNQFRLLRSFRVGVIWRITLLVASILLFLTLLTQTEFLLSTLFAFVLVIAALISLIRYVEQTNLRLTRFLNSIYYDDFSVSFSNDEKGESFQALQHAFNNIADKFRKERADRQESIRYLETVIQHVGIGLLSFDRKGNVSLINNSAKRMLNVPALQNVRETRQVSDALCEKLLELNGGQRTLLRFERDGEVVHWALYATEFIMRSEHYKLISLQNISSELDEKEMEAWQNLTQVLAHEIMNSITPIASLSETVNSILESRIETRPSTADRVSDSSLSIDPETLADVREALLTIHKRSHGLMRFVRSYRDFTQIPKPDLEILSAGELLSRVRNLMKGEFDRLEIRSEIQVEPESLTLLADQSLIDQVLINLTKNALRAVESTPNPTISYQAYLTSRGRVEIQVQDNGPGIKKELLDKIFIPFYTSTSEDGSKSSGIGLSLSRQIMRIHRGSLTVRSTPGQGTVFTLRF